MDNKNENEPNKDMQIEPSGHNDHIDNKSMMETSTIPIEWSKENEAILIEWCDVAQCYKWLNLRAHGKFAYLHAWFTIPAITLSYYWLHHSRKLATGPLSSICPYDYWCNYLHWYSTTI